jgi:hypothetical protein
MPATPQRPAVGNRQPGGIPKLLQYADRLAAREGKSAELLAPIVAALREITLVQDRINQRLAAAYLGYPAQHAETHKGGVDTVETTLLPTPITLGAVGAIGSPTEGFASSQHEHPTTGLDWLLALADLEVDVEDGIPVYDQQMRWLLEMILVETTRIRELVEGQQ